MKLDAIRSMDPRYRLLYWIKERESIRLLRTSGGAKPWTDDPILQGYRFCNVRRMDDRVSRWIEDNWYVQHWDHPNMLYAAALARFFNLPETLEVIAPYVFRGAEPLWKEMHRALENYKHAEKGRKVFNGAYMVRGNDGIDKIDCVINHYVLPLRKVTVRGRFLKEDHAAILTSYGMGSFMAGQIVMDLRWAMGGSWRDRKRWAPIGPGSLKGMNYVYSRPAKKPISQDQFLEELTELRGWLIERLPPSIHERLEAMDYQNCLCEFRAYNEALMGVKNPKRRYL